MPFELGLAVASSEIDSAASQSRVGAAPGIRDSWFVFEANSAIWVEPILTFTMEQSKA